MEKRVFKSSLYIKVKIYAKEVDTMNGKIKPCDNASNQQNANKGRDDVNRQYSQVHGNSCKQLNPNNSENKK